MRDRQRNNVFIKMRKSQVRAVWKPIGNESSSLEDHHTLTMYYAVFALPHARWLQTKTRQRCQTCATLQNYAVVHGLVKFRGSAWVTVQSSPVSGFVVETLSFFPESNLCETPIEEAKSQVARMAGKSAHVSTNYKSSSRPWLSYRKASRCYV